MVVVVPRANFGGFDGVLSLYDVILVWFECGLFLFFVVVACLQTSSVIMNVNVAHIVGGLGPAVGIYYRCLVSRERS